MKADVWQTGRFEQFLKCVVQVAVIQLRASCGGKNQIVLYPPVTRELPLYLLRFQIDSEALR